MGWAGRRAGQNAHFGCAIGKGGGDGFRPDLRWFIHAKRDDMRRQTASEARACVDQFRAVAFVVQQDNRRDTCPGRVIGRQPRAKALHDVVNDWQRIGCRTRRAGSGTLTAARADIGVNHNSVARGQNRAGGA